MEKVNNSSAIIINSKRKFRIAGFCLLILSALCNIAGMLAFSKESTSMYGWAPYMGSAILFMGALYLLVPYKPVSSLSGQITILMIVVGVLIISIGIFMRVFRLDVQPFGIWNDEVDIGMIANRIISNPNYRSYIVPDNQMPLHFYTIVALSFQLFGIGIIGIRIVTVAMGMASIIFAFLVGREANGNLFGLLFAFIFAVSRWHINFSRFGVYTMSVSFFGLLAIWFLIRTKRTHQIHDFAWAGFALGYGLNFYIAARLTVVAIGLYLLYELLLTIWKKLSPVGNIPYPRTKLMSGLLALIVSFWLATAPLIQYAVIHPDLYWDRSNQVSIFNQRDEPNLIKALYNNTITHLMMFNFHGDNNGRHNLPGEPMLDPAMGILFVLGACISIIRFRNPINLLMLILFIIGLMGGILSLDFEAPQSTRAFNAIIPVLFFVSLAIETLWNGISHQTISQVLKRTILILASIAIGSYMIFYNAETYFVKQANNDRVWYEYNGIETTTAYRMKKAFSDSASIYASVYLNNHNVIQFLAPEISGTKTLVPPNGFPLIESGNRPVVIFVDNSSTWILDQVKQYYPNASIQIDTSPSGTPALYTVEIPISDIQRLQGVEASYWKENSPSGKDTINRLQMSMTTDWPDGYPLNAPIMGQWESTLMTPLYGTYRFILQTPAKASLWLDNQLLFSSLGYQEASLTLATGIHSLRLQTTSESGSVRLYWQQPDPNNISITGATETIPTLFLFQPNLVLLHGLLGTYYNGLIATGTPAFTRIDPFIDMYIHLIPLPRPYTVDWTGLIEIPTTGNWTFGLDLNGQAELWIDGQSIINATLINSYLEGPIELTAGSHRIYLHFVDNVEGSRIHLYWIPPLGERQVVPTMRLKPSL